MSLTWTPEMKQIAKGDAKGLVKLQLQMKHTSAGGSVSVVGPMSEKRCMALYRTASLKDDDPKLDRVLAVFAEEEAVEPSEFSRLEVTDQFTYLTYSLNGVPLDEARGGLVDVLWPDDSVQRDMPFTSVKSKTTYFEQGSGPTHGTCYHLWIMTSIRGMERNVNLRDLRIANVRQP